MDTPSFLDFAYAMQEAGLRTAPLGASATKNLAAEFNPQSLSLDENAAAASLFKGLAASGWYTATLTVRLIESDLNPAGGVVKVKTTTLNQRGEAVQVSVGNAFVPRR